MYNPKTTATGDSVWGKGKQNPVRSDVQSYSQVFISNLAFKEAENFKTEKSASAVNQ
jgi:hypothetical protein